MNKVQIVYFGRPALVDADQVKKLGMKQVYVDSIKVMLKTLEEETDAVRKQMLREATNDLSRKLIKLNRTIRQNVTFI